MPAKKPEKRYVLVRERTLQSLVQDFGSFAMIVASFWFNYTYIGGNDALDILLFLCFFMFAIGRATEMKQRIVTKVEEVK